MYYKLQVKARFQYKRGTELSFYFLLIFPRLKSKQALSEAKKLIKQRKNNSFHVSNGNEPLEVSLLKIGFVQKPNVSKEKEKD